MQTNKKIIVINGNGGVGKDTLVNGLENHDIKVLNISSITPILDIFERSKETLRNCGINVNDIKKDEKLRKLFSQMKEAYDEYTSLSMNYLFQTTCDFLKSDFEVMFVHIREPENIAKFKTVVKDNLELDIKTILVVRDTKTVWHNSSDDNVSNYDYDVVFDNNADKDVKITEFAELIRSL